MSFEIIGIDHIYIAVSDLKRSEEFYDRLMRILGFRKNIFTNEGDHHIQYYNRHFGFVLRPARHTGCAHDPFSPGLHHFCFRVSDTAAVDAIASQFAKDSIPCSAPQLYPEYAADYYAIFFSDPDGIRLEITNYREERRKRFEEWDKAISKTFALFCLCIILFTTGQAADAPLKGMTSPKLKQFLASHPEASKCLSQALSDAFSDRQVRLYYFYSDEVSVPRAFHYYPDQAKVGIGIRENQSVCDEFICLLFEVLNSEGESRFRELQELAEAGTITKADFVSEVLRKEYEAVKKTRDLIARIHLGKKEITESYYYKKFIRTPDRYEEWLSFVRNLPEKHYDSIKGYEEQYDSLRKAHSEQEMKEKLDKDFHTLFPGSQ